MAAEPADEGLRLIDMPPEIVQKVAFDSGVLSPADVANMKKCCHQLRDLLGGGNAAGDRVALRKHGRLLGPRARGKQKNGIRLLVEGDQAGAIFRWEVLRESPTRRRNQPLRTACKYGRLDAVRYLLTRKGVDPGTRDIGRWDPSTRYSNAPAVYAAVGGHVEVVRALYADGLLRLDHPEDLLQYLLAVIYWEPHPDLPWALPFEESKLARAAAVGRAGVFLRDSPPEASELLRAWVTWQRGNNPYAVRLPPPPEARKILGPLNYYIRYEQWKSVSRVSRSKSRIYRAGDTPGVTEDELAGLCWLYSLFD